MGRSWKINPNIFLKFPLSRWWLRPFSGKLIHFAPKFLFPVLCVFQYLLSFYIGSITKDKFMETDPSFVIGLDEFSRDRLVSSPKTLKSVIGRVFQESVLPRMVANKVMNNS